MHSNQTSLTAFFFFLFSIKSFIYVQSQTASAFMSHIYISCLAAMSRWQVRFSFLRDASDDDKTWMRSESSQPIGFSTQLPLSSVVTDRLGKQRNVRNYFLHNKSQRGSAATAGRLLITYMHQSCFSQQQASSRPMATRLCADVHCNNRNIQPVLMILLRAIFVLWRTWFKILMNTCTCTRVLLRLSSCYWSPDLPHSTTLGTILI